MIRVVGIILLALLIGSTVASGQKLNGSADWRNVEVCGLSFSIPRSLKDQKPRGIDSCVADYKARNISLSLDYGWYSGVTRSTSYLDYEEVPFEVDGRKGNIATYRETGRDNKQYWIARIFIVVMPRTNGAETAFNMFITVNDLELLDTAKKILQSVRIKD